MTSFHSMCLMVLNFQGLPKRWPEPLRPMHLLRGQCKETSKIIVDAKGAFPMTQTFEKTKWGVGEELGRKSHNQQNSGSVRTWKSYHWVLGLAGAQKLLNKWKQKLEITQTLKNCQEQLRFRRISQQLPRKAYVFDSPSLSPQKNKTIKPNE